jgi:predicted homoserine dehydrogenase-like protein
VITRAKKDLKAGETLDGIGGFLTYGIAENSRATREVRGFTFSIFPFCAVHPLVRTHTLLLFPRSH